MSWFDSFYKVYDMGVVIFKIVSWLLVRLDCVVLDTVWKEKAQVLDWLFGWIKASNGNKVMCWVTLLDWY